jgi:[ribosomal protein S5]-alanine N-acetyltransferase
MTLEATMPTPSKLTLGVEASTPDIQTPRLELIAITLEMIHAGQSKSPDLAKLINADLPEGWPQEDWDDHAYEYVVDKMTRYPNSHGWGRYIALKPTNKGRRILIGTCGATLPLELNDDTEIGYGILPAYQRRGYANEAVAALVEWIFSHPHIRSVNAQTFPHLEPSKGLLVKNGFQFVGPGPGPEEGTILFRKWREGTVTPDDNASVRNRPV